MADELIQIPRPDLGRPTDSRLTQAYLDARPELKGLTPFNPATDFDLIDTINDRLGQLHALVLNSAGGTLTPEQLDAVADTTASTVSAQLLPRQVTILSRGSIGQPTWDTSTAQALADVGPGGVLHLPGVAASVSNPTGAATYVYDAVPDFSDVAVSADPGVTISVPSLNGVSLNDWRLLTPLNVRVRDRQHDVLQAPTATGLDWLAQLAQGSLWHDIGLTRPAPLDGTTLSLVRRYTASSARDTGQLSRLPNGLTWWSGQSGGGIDAAVMTDPAPGTHASACMDTGFAPVGRVGVLIEAGTDYLYLSTDATNVYTGLYSAGAGWVETSKPLPSAAYSAIGTGMPEYAWRIVSDREAEVYINGVEVARYTFASDITSAGWGVYYTTLGDPGFGSGFNVYAEDLVMGTSERAHLGRPVVIGIQGDSVSYGEGLNVGWVEAMTAALRGEAGISRVGVINRAVSGQNSTQQRASLEAAGAVGQTATVIAVGINDQQQFADLGTYRDNLVAMVTRIRADGSIPVLVVPHAYLDKRDPNHGFASQNYAQAGRYHAVVRRVAAELGVICADAAAAVGVVSPDTVYTVTRDNLHPTVQAAVQIGREVARAVMQAITTRVTASTVTVTPTPTPSSGRTTVRRTFGGAGTVTVQLPPGVVEVRAGWVWDGTIRSIQVISAISQVSGAGSEAKLTHVAPDPQLSAALSTSGLLSLSSTVNMPGHVDVTYEVWSP